MSLRKIFISASAILGFGSAAMAADLRAPEAPVASPAAVAVKAPVNAQAVKFCRAPGYDSNGKEAYVQVRPAEKRAADAMTVNRQCLTKAEIEAKPEAFVMNPEYPVAKTAFGIDALGRSTKGDVSATDLAMTTTGGAAVGGALGFGLGALIDEALSTKSYVTYTYVPGKDEGHKAHHDHDYYFGDNHHFDGGDHSFHRKHNTQHVVTMEQLNSSLCAGACGTDAIKNMKVGQTIRTEVGIKDGVIGSANNSGLTDNLRITYLGNGKYAVDKTSYNMITAANSGGGTNARGNVMALSTDVSAQSKVFTVGATGTDRIAAGLAASQASGKPETISVDLVGGKGLKQQQVQIQVYYDSKTGKASWQGTDATDTSTVLKLAEKRAKVLGVADAGSALGDCACTDNKGASAHNGRDHGHSMTGLRGAFHDMQAAHDGRGVAPNGRGRDGQQGRQADGFGHSRRPFDAAAFGKAFKGFDYGRFADKGFVDHTVGARRGYEGGRVSYHDNMIQHFRAVGQSLRERGVMPGADRFSGGHHFEGRGLEGRGLEGRHFGGGHQHEGGKRVDLRGDRGHEGGWRHRDGGAAVAPAGGGVVATYHHGHRSNIGQIVGAVIGAGAGTFEGYEACIDGGIAGATNGQVCARPVQVDLDRGVIKSGLVFNF